MATLRADTDDDSFGTVPDAAPSSPTRASATPAVGDFAHPAERSPVQAWGSGIAIVAALAAIVVSAFGHGGLGSLIAAVAIGMALTSYLGARGTRRAGFLSIAAGGLALLALLIALFAYGGIHNAELPNAAP